MQILLFFICDFHSLNLCSSEHSKLCFGRPKYFRYSETTCRNLPFQSREMYAYKKVKYFYYQTKLIHYLCIKFNLVIDMEAYK